MKPELLARIVAFTLIILGLGFVGYGVLRHRAAIQDLAAFQENQAQLNSKIKQAKERIAADNRERGQLQAAIKKSRAAAGATHRDATIALISSNPKLLDLCLRNFRANLNQSFGVFYWLTGLSSRQIAKFEDLLLKNQEATIDLKAAAASQGLNDNDPAIAGISMQQIDQLQADEIALLGQTGYQQLQRYNRAQGALTLVNGTAYFALGTSDAFSYTQAAQLMQIMANTSPSYEQGGSFDPKSVDWDSVVAQATGFLSQTQLTALKTQAQAVTLGLQLLPGYFAQESGKR
jgi:hypothetical protein